VLTLFRHVEDGCQKRKVQGKKVSGKDRSSVVKLRAKPAPSSIAMSVPSAFTPPTDRGTPLVKLEGYSPRFDR
jgi:hypothetical protein